jgi:ubiquinone/menaquinone biosynthesis C-methylase UbiE
MFADATRLPFPDDAFDLALAIEVMEHIPQPARALDELARVCTGTLVLSVPFEPVWRAGNLARRRYVRDWGNTPGHVNHWTRWGFRRFVADRFTVERVSSPLPWTMVRATTR